MVVPPPSVRPQAKPGAKRASEIVPQVSEQTMQPTRSGGGQSPDGALERRKP